MKVVKLILIETGTYNDQFLRPLGRVGNNTLSNNTLSRLVDATNNGNKITASDLAGTASAVLRPTTEDRGMASIENSWDTRRFSFMMEVIVAEMEAMGHRQQRRYFVSGHTDHVGISMLTGKHSFDPNMRLYFNNVVVARTRMEVTGYGYTPMTTFMSANQIVTGQSAPDLGRQQMGHLTVRPEDVLRASEVPNALDARSTFATNKMKMNSRVNSVPALYLNRTLNALSSAASEDNNFFGSHGDVVVRAAGHVKEETLNADQLFSRLLDVTSLQSESSISLGELQHFDSNVMSDEVMKVFLQGRMQPTIGQDMVEGVHTRGSSEHWQGRNNETIVATMIAQMLPAFMSAEMVTKLSFIATNDTPGGIWDIRIMGIWSLFDIPNLSEAGMVLSKHLEHYVMREVSSNGNLIITVNGVIDLLCDSRLNVSVENYPFVLFCSPTFADGMFSPVLTANTGDINAIVEDLRTITDHLAHDHSPEVTNYSIANTFGGGRQQPAPVTMVPSHTFNTAPGGKSII